MHKAYSSTCSTLSTSRKMEMLWIPKVGPFFNPTLNFLLSTIPISCEKEKPSRKLDSKKSYPDLLWVLFKGNKSFLDTDGYCNGYIFTDKRRLMDLGKKTFRCLRKLGQVLHIRTHHHHLFEFLMFYVYFTSHASRAQQQQQRSFPLPGMLRWRWENSRKHFVFRHKDISWQPAPL